MTTTYLAWCNEADVVFGPEFLVIDEDVVSYEITHAEGDFALLSIVVRNPRVGLLSAGRQQWIWLSISDGSTDGALPLFRGRLIGVPQDVIADAVTLKFVARPADLDAQKRALAETLKERPYWDPVWIAADKRDDLDVVLEARTQLYHYDRVNHTVSVSDIAAGEDGTLEIGGALLRDTLAINFATTPARKVKVKGTLEWDQVVSGQLNITKQLLRAGTIAGSPPYLLTTFTGQGFAEDWPKRGDRIGRGWEFGITSLRRVDGKLIQEYQEVVTVNGRAQFPRWSFQPVLNLRYDAERRRVETVSFTLAADVQALLAEPGDEAVVPKEFTTGDVGAPIDAGGLTPIGDRRNRAYLPTSRGLQSIEYLIAWARAQLVARSRAVTISFDIAFSAGAMLGLSCRKNAHIEDSRLPGGEATGKIIAYSLKGNGNSGEFRASITIGCMIGKGGTVTTVPGDPEYVEEGVLEEGIQVYLGQTIMPVSGAVTYGTIGHINPNDDGLNFLNLRPEDVITTLTVSNGEAVQRAILTEFNDAAEAIDALNEVFTEVIAGNLVPVQAGPFTTDYPLTVSELKIAKTIDLESAA